MNKERERKKKEMKLVLLLIVGLVLCTFTEAIPCFKPNGVQVNPTEIQIKYEELDVDFSDSVDLEKMQYNIIDGDGTVLREYSGVVDKEGNVYLFASEECRFRAFWAPLLKAKQEACESLLPSSESSKGCSSEDPFSVDDETAYRIWRYIDFKLKEKEKENIITEQ